MTPRLRALSLMGLVGLTWAACGVDTDTDRDGFYTSPQLEGSYLYDCVPDDPSLHEGLAYYRDGDGDGYGDASRVCYICISAAEEAPPSTDAIDEVPCEADISYVFNNFDCDDGNEKVFQARQWYRDSDNDGLGDPSLALGTRTCPTDSNDSAPEGYVDNNLDCDDGSTTAGTARTFFFDDDGDGFGGDLFILSCTYSEDPDADGYLQGYVSRDDSDPAERQAKRDCDDERPDINPGVAYDCDGSDDLGYNNDCDDVVDEDKDNNWYPDEDQDGYGDPTREQSSCEPPDEGWTNNGGDCNDDDDQVPEVNPCEDL